MIQGMMITRHLRGQRRCAVHQKTRFAAGIQARHKNTKMMKTKRLRVSHTTSPSSLVKFWRHPPPKNVATSCRRCSMYGTRQQCTPTPAVIVRYIVVVMDADADAVHVLCTCSVCRVGLLTSNVSRRCQHLTYADKHCDTTYSQNTNTT